MINEALRVIWEKNSKISQKLNENTELIKAKVSEFESNGLRYIDDDYYVYRGKGGIKIHETPKGVKKRIAQIAHKYNLSVVVTDGLFYKGDEISVESDGTIEDIKIKKNSNALIMGGDILAPYAIVSVFKDSVMITRKLFIVPNDEYIAIKNMGSGNKFQTMMAYKMVYKRVLNGIYSLLGVTLDRVDAKMIDEMAENMRVDNEKEDASEEIDTLVESEKIMENVDLLDAESLDDARKNLMRLYAYEVDADRKEELKKAGVKIKEAIDAIN